MKVRRWIIPITAAALVLLQGCETTEGPKAEARANRERQEAVFRNELFQRLQMAEERCYEILHGLGIAGADYREKETFGYLGAIFSNQDFYTEALAREVKAAGLDNRVSVRYVASDSPAERAGLLRGDRPLEINGKKVPHGSGAAIFAAEKLKRLIVPGEPNTLLIERGEQQLPLEIEPIKASHYGVLITPYPGIHFQSEGNLLTFSLEAVEHFDRRGELPFMIAYALAQNIMRHEKMRGQNRLLGQLVDMAAAMGGVNTGGLFGNMGQNAYAAAFAIESDVIALYLLANIGANIGEYAAFWKKNLLAQSKKGQLSKQDEERLEKINTTIAQIEEKRANGEPLRPDEYLSGDTSALEAQAEPEVE